MREERGRLGLGSNSNTKTHTAWPRLLCVLAQKPQSLQQRAEPLKQTSTRSETDAQLERCHTFSLALSLLPQGIGGEFGPPATRASFRRLWEDVKVRCLWRLFSGLLYLTGGK